ncbi:MAG TPA: type II toxin-antitoxin system VapC family toxin [Candidatus Acidoferrum sp.]|jgi:predicted nucleic acid-binding protein|nr:type II toxin-antitoxin system VapC family toxin [Candidatus Acidoferrum sp.]
MATLVLDASVFLSWLFPDEENEWSKQLVFNLGEEDRVVVPAHWLVEIANALLVGSRRKRIKTEQIAAFLGQLAIIPVEIESALSLEDAERVAALGAKHSLSAYDAAYLDLALRKNVALGTLDGALRNASMTEKVRLL